MAHILLRHAAAIAMASPHLRRRAVRPKAGVKPAHADEFWYRHRLTMIAHALDARAAELVAALEEVYPRRADDAWVVVDGAVVRVTAQDARRSGPPTSVDRLIDREAARFGDISSTADQIAGQLAARVSRSVDQRLAALIARAIGIDLAGTFDATDMVAPMRRAIRENVALIKSIPAQYFDDVRAAVRKAFVEGWRWEALVTELRKIGNTPADRAKVIARDQVSKLNAKFNEARQTSLGITEYIWRGVMDQRERPSHRNMEGERCRWAAPPLVDGENVHPGEAILCRCSAIPVIDLAALREAA